MQQTYIVDKTGSLKGMDLPVIGDIDFNTVRPRDTIYLMFGYRYLQAIVKNVNSKGIVFTAPNWLKEENVFISFHELAYDNERSPMFHGPRYSKLKWFLKF